MHKKNELESMSSDELAALAKSLGVKVISDQTELIYNIIDAESVQPVASPEKKKRTTKKAEKAEKPATKKAAKEEKAEKPAAKKAAKAEKAEKAEKATKAEAASTEKSTEKKTTRKKTTKKEDEEK